MSKIIEINIGFIFTNYNNSNLSKSAVESILATNPENIQIVIVDNASKLEHRNILQKIETTYDNVHVIYNEQNIGYFPGLNLGIKYMKNSFPLHQYLVIGNNDLIFPQNFIKNLTDKTELFSKYPVISPDIVTIDGVHQNPHLINDTSKLRKLAYNLYYLNYIFAFIINKLANITRGISSIKDHKSYKIPQEIYQGYGACYILGPLFFKHFDRLWAPTFLMHEELFLSEQLLGKNFKIFYEPSISIIHLHNASTGKLSGRQKWLYSQQAYRKQKKLLN